MPSRATRNAPVKFLNVPHGGLNTAQSSVFVRAPSAINFLAHSPTSFILTDPIRRRKGCIVPFTTSQATFLLYVSDTTI